MKRFATSLLLVTAVLLGTAKAQAAVVFVAGGPVPYYAPYYAPYYHAHTYYGYHRPWVRHYYAVSAPRPVYYAPTSRPYYYAPASVVVAPVFPLALSVGLHIREER